MHDNDDDNIKIKAARGKGALAQNGQVAAPRRVRRQFDESVQLLDCKTGQRSDRGNARTVKLFLRKGACRTSNIFDFVNVPD